MHEYHLAEDLMDLVRREMAGHSISKVYRIKFSVGELSTISPESLEFLLKTASRGSSLENARMEFVKVKKTREMKLISIEGE